MDLRPHRNARKASRLAATRGPLLWTTQRAVISASASRPPGMVVDHCRHFKTTAIDARMGAFRDLLSSETEFVSQLSRFCKQVLQPLAQERIISSVEIGLLFSNIIGVLADLLEIS